MNTIKRNDSGMGLIGALVVAVCVASLFTMTTNIFFPFKERMQHTRLRYFIEKLKGKTLHIPYSSIIKSIPSNPSFTVCFLQSGKGCTVALEDFELLDPTGDYAISSGTGVAYNEYNVRCSFSDSCPFRLNTKAEIKDGHLDIYYTLNTHPSVPIIAEKNEWKTSANIQYIKNLEKHDGYIYFCDSSKRYVLQGIDHEGNAICLKRRKVNKFRFTGSIFDILNGFNDIYATFKMFVDAL